MIEYLQYPKKPFPEFAMFLWGNPNRFKDTVDREMMASSGYNDGKGPQRDPKDVYVLIGTILGVIICCTAGALIGAMLGGFGGIFLGIVAGLFIGGFGGSYLGEKIKNRKYKPRNRKETKDDQGPFVT